MQLLADENLPKDAVDALRRDGHDVIWIRTEAPGISDREVLNMARRERRVIVTFDKDFGEMTFHAKSPSTGVVLFRLPPTPDIGEIIVQILREDRSWQGHFSVVDERRVRMRSLPKR